MFIDPTEIKDVYLYVDPVDFRKGIYGLGVYISHGFGDALNGKNLFVFSNRNREKIRIIYWDDTGYALWHKVLESDRFKWPKKTTGEVILSVNELKYLLSGINIEEQKPHKIQHPKAFF